MSTVLQWVAEEKRKVLTQRTKKRERKKETKESAVVKHIREWRLLCLRGQSPARGPSIPRNTRLNSFNRTQSKRPPNLSPTSPPSPSPPPQSPRRRRPRPTPSQSSLPSPTPPSPTKIPSSYPPARASAPPRSSTAPV